MLLGSQPERSSSHSALRTDVSFLATLILHGTMRACRADKKPIRSLNQHGFSGPEWVRARPKPHAARRFERSPIEAIRQGRMGEVFLATSGR